MTSDSSAVFFSFYFYKTNFLQKGLIEIRSKFGTSTINNAQLLYETFAGHKICSIVQKAHILTGCSITNKIGTKNMALKGDHIEYLWEFGESTELRNKEAGKTE